MFKELSKEELMMVNGEGIIDDLGEEVIDFIPAIYRAVAAFGQGVRDGWISKHGDVKPREYEYSR